MTLLNLHHYMDSMVFLADFLVLDKKCYKFCSFFTNFMAF